MLNSALDMSENMKAYTPAPARLYVHSLGEARLPNNVPDKVNKMLRDLLGTFNFMMKISCQPLYRKWNATHHPMLGVVLLAVTGGRGPVFGEVESQLATERLDSLFDPRSHGYLMEKGTSCSLAPTDDSSATAAHLRQGG